MEQHEFFTIEEVAAKLRVHPLTIRRKIKKGKLGANLIGGQYRISQEDFEIFIQETKTTPKQKEDEDAAIVVLIAA